MMLTILTPLSSRIEDITWVELDTTVGNMIIQPGHVPMVLELLAEKAITFGLKNGKQETIRTKKGFVEVTRTSVTLIIHEIL